MNRIFHYILFSIFLTPNLLWANHQIDSLQSILTKSVGTDRTLVLLDLTNAYLTVDSDKAIEYANESYGSAVRANMEEEKILSVLLKGKAYYHKGELDLAWVEVEKSAEQFGKSKNKDRESEAISVLGHIKWKQGAFDKAILLYNQALDIQKRINRTDLQIQSYLNLGVVYRDEANSDKALELFLKALELSNKSGDMYHKANALNNLAGIYWKLGRNDKALKNYLESLELRRKAGSLSEIASSLSNIGIVYKDMSAYEEALKYHLQALNIKRQIGNDNDISYSLIQIGHVFLNLGKYSESLEYYNMALEIRTELNDEVGISNTYDNIGLVHKKQSENDQALSYFSKSLSIREKLANNRLIAKSLNNIGSVYWKMDRYDKALGHFIQALEVLKTYYDLPYTAKLLNNVGIIYMELLNYKLAINYHERALGIYEGLGNQIQMAVTLNYIGNVYWHAKDFSSALKNYMQALRLREEIGNQSSIASSLKNIGLIYRDMDDYNKSIEFYNNALSVYEQIGNKLGYASVLNNIGDVYMHFNKPVKAIDFYKKSLTIKKEINDKRGIAITSLNIGQLYLKNGNYSGAKPYLTKARLIAEGVGESELLKNVAYENYLLYSKLGDVRKTLTYFQEYSNQKDSMLNRENSKRISELQIRFEMTLKENEIENLKKQKELDDIRIGYQLKMVIALIVCFLLAVYAAIQFYLRLKSKKKANVLLEKIFSVIAHDLREPASSLSNMSYLLSDQSSVSEQEKKEIVGSIASMAQSMNGLLDNLLSWSHSQRGGIVLKAEKVNPLQITENNIEVLKHIALDKNIKFKNEIVESLNLFADRNSVSLVIRNLLSNALKYSFDNSEIRIFAYSDHQNIVIGVEDFGKGISPEKIKSLFQSNIISSEPGTRSEMGTGMGLKICTDFVRANKGRIWAESILNKHTIFYFSLPEYTVSSS